MRAVFIATIIGASVASIVAFGEVPAECNSSYLQASQGNTHLSFEAINGILTSHNEARRRVTPYASFMPMLQWDENLATFAQEIASTCNADHTTTAQRSNATRFSGFSYVGENLAQFTSRGDVDQMTGSYATTLWNNEIEFWSNFSCMPNEVCGHYTQNIWAATTHVGCGAYNCMINQQQWTMWRCIYGPGGNYLGQNPYRTADTLEKSATCTYNRSLAVPSTTITTTKPAGGNGDMNTTTTKPATGGNGDMNTTTTKPATGGNGDMTTTTTKPAGGNGDMNTTTKPAGSNGEMSTTKPAGGNGDMTATTKPAAGGNGNMSTTTTKPAATSQPTSSKPTTTQPPRPTIKFRFQKGSNATAASLIAAIAQSLNISVNAMEIVPSSENSATPTDEVEIAFTFESDADGALVAADAGNLNSAGVFSAARVDTDSPNGSDDDDSTTTIIIVACCVAGVALVGGLSFIAYRVISSGANSGHMKHENENQMDQELL